jgi:hypothetical protein
MRKNMYAATVLHSTQSKLHVSHSEPKGAVAKHEQSVLKVIV